MDEILHYGPQPRAEAAPQPKKTLGEWLADHQPQFAAALCRWDSFKAKHPVKAVPFLAAALAAGVALTVSTVYTRGLAVTVDGQELGVVADTAQVEAVVARVENRASEILGRPYTLATEITYQPRVVEKSELSQLPGLEELLFSQVGEMAEVAKTYVLTVGGQELGATEEGEILTNLLEQLKAPYMNENTVSAEFTVPVAVEHRYTSTAEMRDIQEFRRLLTSNSLEEVTYTVKAGNNYYSIAENHDMTLDQLMEMNPQASLDTLYPGDVLTVRQSVPYLSVRTVDQVSYEEAIPAPVEYVQDDTMYQGESKTLEEGAEGTALVRANITYVNGGEQSREVLASKTLEEPATKVVAQGTKERPRTMPTGSLIWPVRGHITSGYKYRSLFGTYKFHGGIDIAVSYGTTIKAADGGTVVTSGWNSGGYGYYVVIDHGNGRTTHYGHNSKLLVRAGDRVYQGQAIAKAGSTGRSTGVHCHFEVRVNGERRNPRNYLP